MTARRPRPHIKAGAIRRDRGRPVDESPAGDELPALPESRAVEVTTSQGSPLVAFVPGALDPRDVGAWLVQPRAWRTPARIMGVIRPAEGTLPTVASVDRPADVTAAWSVAVIAHRFDDADPVVLRRTSPNGGDPAPDPVAAAVGGVGTIRVHGD